MVSVRSKIRVSNFLFVGALITVALLAGSHPLSGQGSGANGARLLQGAIDLHLHVDPMPYGASFETLRLARSRGMRGVVVKNHYESTVDLAYLLRKEMPGFEVFGGLDLNWIAGGLNHAEVEHMTQVPGKPGRFIWLTTYDSENQVRNGRLPPDQRPKNPPPPTAPFIQVSKNGELVPDVKRIISVIAKNGFVLATGHVSPEEGLMMVREGKKQGVQHMVVTHPMDQPVFMNVPQMKEAASLGAFIEFDFRNTLTGGRTDAMRQIGPQYCFISEFWTKTQAPLEYAGLEGVAAFAAAMRKLGFTDRELDMMFKENPARVLGL